MKKPPAGLGSLSALSGWVLTVYLHKYLSPSYAACLCDSLYLSIFPSSSQASWAMPGQMPPAPGTLWCPEQDAQPHPFLLPCGTSLEIQCVTHGVLFSPGCQDKIKSNSPTTLWQLGSCPCVLAGDSKVSPGTTVPAPVAGTGDATGLMAAWWVMQFLVPAVMWAWGEILKAFSEFRSQLQRQRQPSLPDQLFWVCCANVLL